MYLLVIYMSKLFGPLDHFFKLDYLEFVAIELYEFLSNLYINCLSDIGFTNIFSHSIACLFFILHFVDRFFGYAEAF